jgi:hypothetical protein
MQDEQDQFFTSGTGDFETKFGFRHPERMK